jgi:hypothetical protein
MIGSFDISVIIVTYNSRRFIKSCLAALMRSAEGKNWGVVVVDNGSADGSGDAAGEYPNVRVIRRTANEGFAAAVNLGLESSSSEYVLLLNPDAVVTEGSVETMMKYMAGNGNVACVAPQLRNFDGSIQWSCREFPGLRTIIAEFVMLPMVRRRFPKLDRYRMGYFDHCSLRDVDQPMASCVLLRRSALNDAGHLDESMPIFFNDVDLCRRIKDKGWRIVFLPEAKVYHYCGASTRSMGINRQLHIARSMYTYLRKYSPGIVAYAGGLLLLVGYFLKISDAAVFQIRKG